MADSWKSQHSPKARNNFQEEVEMSKQLAHVQIHVERVIGLLKKKYTLLEGPIPIPLLQVKDDSTLPSIDKIPWDLCI